MSRLAVPSTLLFLASFLEKFDRFRFGVLLSRLRAQSSGYLLQKSVYYLFFTLVFAQTVLTSWVDEDAFVTFRVVDNFVHGFGLRWNINERVQAYTNPLWMLLHIPVYDITGNIVLTTSLLGWACLLASLLLARDTFQVSPLRYTALFLVPLLVTPTNAAYFTSGLEGPLLNVSFAAFGYVLIRRPLRFWFWLSLITAASMMTRLDMVILYAPTWAYLLYSHRRNLHWRDMAAGMLPLLGWMVFSLFYYGFILPNTALAKLGGHLPFADYWFSGVAYAYDFRLADPWTALCIVTAALYFPACAWLDRGSHCVKTNLAAALAVGITCYCLYVVSVGGAQLSLRMFSIPAFAVCWLWAWRFPLEEVKAYVGFALLVLLVQFSFALPWDKRQDVPIIKQAKIGGTSWAHHVFVKTGSSLFDYSLAADELAESPDRAPRPMDVQATGVIGQFGYYGGPYHIVIDVAGLSDPLLARLPAVDDHLVKVGDVFRFIPVGYEKAALNGFSDTLPQPLAQYYDKLKLITQGDLWGWERLKTIVLFNFGAYDSLRDDYVRDYYPRKIVD